LFRRLYDDPQTRYENNVHIRLKCGEYRFDFDHEYPARLLPGSWRIAVKFPTTWFREGDWVLPNRPPIPNIAWVSAIFWEGEPGTYELEAHTDTPDKIVEKLIAEQRTANGARAADVAYALAVYDVNREANRDYLLSTLRKCLGARRPSPLEDMCDDIPLIRELADLYWRGDTALLGTFLNCAWSDANVVDEIGRDFYADLLNAPPNDVFDVFSARPPATRDQVCRLAARQGDYRTIEHASLYLANAHSEVADECVKMIKESAIR
jgi:hypothetical protein